MFDERAEKTWTEGKDLMGCGIDNFVWGREGLVILCEREREGGGGVSQPSSHHPASKWPRIL